MYFLLRSDCALIAPQARGDVEVCDAIVPHSAIVLASKGFPNYHPVKSRSIYFFGYAFPPRSRLLLQAVEEQSMETGSREPAVVHRAHQREVLTFSSHTGRSARRRFGHGHGGWHSLGDLGG